MAKIGINQENKRTITKTEKTMSNALLTPLINGLCNCVFWSDKTGNSS